MHTPQKLVEQLQRVADQAQAASAAIYLPTPWEPAARALLLHVGGEAPLSELATQDAAEAFAAEVAETGHWAGHPAAADGIVASRSGDGVLIPVPLLTSLWAGAVAPGTATPRRRQSDGRGPSSTAGWVGLRFAPTPDGSAGPASRTNVLLAHSLASTVVSLYGLLTDPLTGLPGRNELHGALRLDLHRARRRRLPCALVLVNPIGLEWVNAQHGRRAGDAVVREVVQSLQSLLRRSDVLMRYGGAIFALPLGNVGAPAALLVAERVRNHIAARGFLNDSVRLRCAVGVVACEAAQAASSASSPVAPTRTTATWGCCGTCCRCCPVPAAAPSWLSTSSTGCGRCFDRSASAFSSATTPERGCWWASTADATASRCRSAPPTCPRPSGR
jgi:diguanylate cyclase (GGDEF)-like protein